MPADKHHSVQNFDVQMAVQNVLRILNEWGAREEEVCRMLNVDRDELIKWSTRPPQALDEGSMERFGLIEGIADHLKVLFPRNHLRWPHMVNYAPIFSGATPISILRTGNVADIRRVKRWLDGRIY